VPIMMLTARDRVPDKVLGLDSGADTTCRNRSISRTFGQDKALLRRSGRIALQR